MLYIFVNSDIHREDERVERWGEYVYYNYRNDRNRQNHWLERTVSLYHNSSMCIHRRELEKKSASEKARGKAREVDRPQAALICISPDGLITAEINNLTTSDFLREAIS